MNKAVAVLTHLTVILSFMFVVFLILDQFNPMMNFVDNGVSRWLLCALCLGCILRASCPGGAQAAERPAEKGADIYGRELRKS